MSSAAADATSSSDDCPDDAVLAAADATSSSDDRPNDAVLALVGRWQVHAIAGRAATRQQCDALGVNTDVFDLFAVPGATLKSCVVGVDVMAAGSAATGSAGGRRTDCGDVHRRRWSFG